MVFRIVAPSLKAQGVADGGGVARAGDLYITSSSIDVISIGRLVIRLTIERVYGLIVTGGRRPMDAAS